MESLKIFGYALFLNGIVALLFLIAKVWRDRLVYRERKIEEALLQGMFEKSQANFNDGFIFCSLWRLTDVRMRARALGVVLDTSDCYLIIGAIKRDFDKDEGINYLTIDLAIKAYDKQRKAKPDYTGKLVMAGMILFMLSSCVSYTGLGKCPTYAVTYYNRTQKHYGVQDTNEMLCPTDSFRVLPSGDRIVITEVFLN